MLKDQALMDPDIEKAAKELLSNAAGVAVAGFSDVASQALRLLNQEGPWRLPRHGGLRHRYERVLRPVCFLAGSDCPATAELGPMTREELHGWAEVQAFDALQMLGMPARIQIEPLGLGWSRDFLASLPSRMGDKGDPQPHRMFGRFCADVEMLLQFRLAQSLGASASLRDMLPDGLEALGVDLSLLPSGADDLQIAPEAMGIDTLLLVRAITRYGETTGFFGGYMDQLFGCAFLLMVESENSDGAQEVAEAWLRNDPDAQMRLLDLSVVPSVNHLIRRGTFARLMEVDRQIAESWLVKLADRPERAIVPDPEPVARFAHRVDSLDDLEAAFDNSPLADLHWFPVPVIECEEHAWVARLPSGNGQDLWRIARNRVPQTGRWPLLWASWGDPDAGADALSEQLFSRWGYEIGPASDDISPPALVRAARSVDLSDFLDSLVDRSWSEDDLIDAWRRECEQVGVDATDLPRLWLECGQSRLRVERALADRERALGVSDPKRGRQETFRPDDTMLVLLPAAQSWESLAYIHWYGMERGRPEAFIRVLRNWSERFGAELYAHYGTMLEFEVSRPPLELDAALQLALEHESIAPCTLMLPGIALRHYAEGLIGHQTWFLHERP